MKLERLKCQLLSRNNRKIYKLRKKEIAVLYLNIQIRKTSNSKGTESKRRSGKLRDNTKLKDRQLWKKWGTPIVESKEADLCWNLAKNYNFRQGLEV